MLGDVFIDARLVFIFTSGGIDKDTHNEAGKCRTFFDITTNFVDMWIVSTQLVDKVQ